MNAEFKIPPRPTYRLDRDLPHTGAIAILRLTHHWIPWSYTWKADAGKWTKPPRSAHTGQIASATDPASWGSYEQARAVQKKMNLAGVGFVLTAEDEIIGIDLDDCLDEEGQPEEWALAILDLKECYAEVSPSGRGLRLLARGTLPGAMKCDEAGVEIYVSGRYLTLTGERIGSGPDSICEAPRTLELLRSRIAIFKGTKGQSDQRASCKAGGFRIDTGDDFFGIVRAAALADLGAWVPAIFPTAAFQPGTKAWRVSSRDLGRDLEEDLSLSPDGIQDFGEERGLTAIDVVIEHGGAATPLEAALWLCEKLGIDAGAAGYDGAQFAGGPDFDWSREDASNSESASASDEKKDTSAGADTSSGQRSGQSEPGWTEPDARFLRTVLPEPPTLPLDGVFSPGWARWIRTAAEAKGAPGDYVVAALLSAAGALIGNTRWATPWDGWSEVPIVWAMAIGNPSAGKSPGLDAVLTPLKRIEREMRQAAEAEHAEWAKKAEVARLVTSTWNEEVKAALKSGDAPPEKPREADPGPEPAKPRYALADATVEKIAVIISAQPRGTMLARDELSGWLGNMSRYSGGSDRPFWLEAYGGRGYNVERMGRESIWIDHLSVGVVGGIQPDKLKSLLIKSDDDGLLARFLPVWPNPAPIKQPETGIDDAFIDAALRRLLTLAMVPNEAGELRPWYMQFTPQAREALNRFRVDARNWEKDEEGLLLSFVGKLPGLAVRLALVLAFLDWATGESGDVHEIGVEHFYRAAHFIEAYALPMARRAYADGSIPKETRAGTKLAAIIIENRWERFTTSDVLRLNRSGLDTKADLDPALDALETGSLIRALNPKMEGRSRGRPSRTFLVNPCLLRREP